MLTLDEAADLLVAAGNFGGEGEPPITSEEQLYNLDVEMRDWAQSDYRHYLESQIAELEWILRDA